MRNSTRPLSAKTVFFVLYKRWAVALMGLACMLFATYVLADYWSADYSNNNSAQIIPDRAEIQEQGTQITGTITAIVDDGDVKKNGRYGKVVYYTFPTSDSTSDNGMLLTVDDAAYQLQVDDKITVFYYNGHSIIEGLKPNTGSMVNTQELGLAFIIVAVALVGLFGLAALGYFLWLVSRELRVIRYGLSAEAEVVQAAALPQKETSLFRASVIVHYKYTGTTGQVYYGTDKSTEPRFAILKPGDQVQVLFSETREGYSILAPGQSIRA